MDKNSEIVKQIKTTIESGNKVYVGTDWHAAKETDLRSDYGKIIEKQHEVVTENDMFIYLGDIVDDTCYEEHLISSIIRDMNGRYKVLVIGNNDTFTPKEYKDMGFDCVVYAFVYKGYAFSHTSLDVHKINKHFVEVDNAYASMGLKGPIFSGHPLLGNFHGHIHRPTCHCDKIPYYHKCDKNVNICRYGTDLVNIEELIKLFDYLAARNLEYNEHLLERPGMTRFIQRMATEEVIESIIREALPELSKELSRRYLAV